MEAKRWFNAFIVTCTMITLLTTLLTNHFNQLQRTSDASSQQGYLSTLVIWLYGALEFWELEDKVEASKQSVGISPNLSSCHKSYANRDYMVYCCPPKMESDEPFIDFQFPDPSLPKRVRRPIHQVDEDYLAKYTKALTIMKSLPYSDPRSFARQADMHCVFCTGAYNQNNANVSLNIHGTWFFFPWHRMFVYFHERILAKLIDDDTFSLSFWQWDAPEGMFVPQLYMKDPFLDTERSSFHVQPHKIVDVDYSFVKRNLTDKQQISRNLGVMYNQMVSGAKKVELFMGCFYKPGYGKSCNAPGTMELAPHNALHSWVGKETNRFRENMGVFYSAARDPLFWVHHTNVDRLWDVWRELRGNIPEIIDPDWLDSHFFFHDENAQLVRIKIRDALHIDMLGYNYQQVDLPWLNARPKPSMNPVIARHILNTRNNGHLTTHSSEFMPEGRLLDHNIMVKVFMPNVHSSSTVKGNEQETILVVYGIDIKEDMYVKFDVYVNTIDVANVGPESREFAGTYVNVPRGVTLVLNEGDEKIKIKSTLKLGISELLQDLQADKDDFIWVTVVPRGGTGVKTTIDGIRIEYMV